MKKTYKIEVDCAACALKMEEAAKSYERCIKSMQEGRTGL